MGRFPRRLGGRWSGFGVHGVCRNREGEKLDSGGNGGFYTAR